MLGTDSIQRQNGRRCANSTGKGITMGRIALAVAVVAVLFAGVTLSEGKEKKKAKTAPVQTAPASTASAAAPGLPKGWTEVRTGTPDLARAGYKIDGRSIIMLFRNTSRDKTVRFKYQVKWKKHENGRWLDDASMEGISFRLKKQEELTRELRNAGREIKEVVLDVVATEVN